MTQDETNNNLVVLIPTLNEEAAIGDIVEKCLRYTKSIFVIDGLSTDLTIQKAEERGANILICNERGKGRALVYGFNHILKNTNFSFAAYMDGDITYDPDDIPKLLKEAKDHPECDLIIGNRFPLRDKGSITRINMIGNRIFSIFVSLLIKQKINDTQSGLRLITRNSTEFFSKTLKSQNFDIETEMIMKASRKNFKICEVPIYYYRRKGETKLNPLRDGLRILKTILKNRK